MSQGSASIWRRWDLHIHTPASFDYNSKDLSYEALASHLNSSNIDCFAITDHWTVDGYFELRPHIQEEKLLLPGIELRIDKTSRQKGMTGSGVLQCIVLFPQNTSKDDIEKRFLHQIKLCETDNSFITREDLISLGRTKAEEGASDEECYAIGCQQAYVDYKEVVEKARALGGLVCLTYDRHGGFDSIDPVNDSVFKSNLVKDCDLIEVSKEEIQTFFHSNEDVIKACGKKTPCFSGSDAHNLQDIGRSGVWIKSDKSFDGLKQVIYFPKERISFSNTKPTYSYPRIKKIRLESRENGHALSTLDADIEVSENLTAVIGHPSIGKSTFAETTAYVLDGHTLMEPGEEMTKIDNIASINPGLTVKMTLVNGNVESTITRDFSGTYGGNITKDEFQLTYLNQGYIDRTARDPSAVSALVESKMENPELESLWSEIEKTQNALEDARTRYLRKFKLMEARKAIEANLAKTNKSLDISNSAEYKKLVTESGQLQAKEKQMNTLTQELKEQFISAQNYERTLSQITQSLQKAKTLFPSLSGNIPTVEHIPIAEKLRKLLEELNSSSEKQEIERQKIRIASEMQTLLGKEQIHYTEQFLLQQKNKQQLLEQQLEENQEQITACEEAKSEHEALVGALEEQYAQWHDIDEHTIETFNTDLDNVSIQYEPADKIIWLVNVLTYEAKQAWDTFTPDSEKETQRFIRPNEVDIKKILQRISEEKGIEPEQLINYLSECLERKELPIESDLESVRWLFGERSETVREFILLRLSEFSEKGEHQIYFQDKNISKEGLSFTERCGALLEILLEKGTEPILLDQPEENLGSRYITNNLINKLLKKKFERQIILVSHNPNTVVLADSDMVVSLTRDTHDEKMSVLSGAIEADGMRELICNIMEGGEEAFHLRAERYRR